MLAGMDGVKYKLQELQLEPGDVVFLYTDGVTEATNVSNELYGMDRLVEALNTCAGTAEKHILSTVRGSVDTFVGSAPQFDDLTMLSITYNGPGDRTADQKQ